MFIAVSLKNYLRTSSKINFEFYFKKVFTSSVPLKSKFYNINIKQKKKSSNEK